MPKVPEYSNFQTSVAGPSNATFQTPSGPAAGEIGAKQLEQFGQGMASAGNATAKIQADMQAQADQIRVDDAMNKAMAARLKLTYDPNQGYLAKRGQAAVDGVDGKSLDESYGEQFKQSLDSIASGLGNDRQRQQFAHHASQLGMQLQAGINQHVSKEFQDYSVGVQQGTTKLAQDQMGTAWGDVDAVKQSVAAIKAATYQEGQLRGWSAKQIEAITIDQLSKGHAAVVLGALQAGRPEYATEYLKQNDKELTNEARLKLTADTNAVDIQVRGERAADEVWATMAPKTVNDPVRIYDMEQAAREKFKDNPKLKDVALASIKQRAAAFNAQQTEANSAGINTVYGMIDQGVPMSRVQSSPAWLGLPEVKRHEIVKGLESEAATRAARAASEAARGAASEQRDLARMQRNDRMALLTNGEAYLRYGDPDVLAGMTRTQVEALRPSFGFEGTQQLLQRFDTLQNKDARLTARMDDGAFKAVVQETLGIDPYKSGMSSESKAMLGTLKNKVDIMLQHQAQSLRRPLTTEEKTEIMRAETAKTVTVGGWLWSSDKPAAALKPDEAAKVVVPPADKQRLTAQMKRAFDATQDPDYAPTEANLKRLYLKGVSPIAGLPNAK